MRQPTLSEIVDLRLSVLGAHASFGNRAIAKKAILEDHRLALESAKKSGLVESLYDARGKLRAALICGRAPLFWGENYFQIKVLLRPKDAIALSWMKKRLRENRSFFNRKAFLRLDSKNKALLKDILALGFHLDSLILAGDPKVAYRQLKKRYPDLSWKDQNGLEVSFLKTGQEVEAVIQIMKTEFTRNPQYGWFVTTPAFLQHERKMLNRERKKDRVTQYLIKRKEKIVGHFGFELSSVSPFGVSSAGMVFNFSKKIQAQGLAKLAYFTMLKQMLELGVELFLGGTSQKPVMKLGKLMKRPLVAYSLKTGSSYFNKNHFKYP